MVNYSEVYARRKLPFRELMRKGDVPGVHRWLCRRLCVPIPRSTVVLWLSGCPGYHDDDSLLMWWKNRLTILHSSAGAPDINIPVPLHVFFLGIEETEEQLALLRNDPAVRNRYLELARSRLWGTTHFPVPIDTNAYRVADPKGGN